MYQRKSTKIKGYNYKQNGVFFITLCVNQQLCLFGQIRQKKLEMNAAGKMVQKTWIEIPKFYKNTYIDTFIVMPNHFHGIIIKMNDKSPPRPLNLFDKIIQTLISYNLYKSIDMNTMIFNHTEMKQNRIKGSLQNYDFIEDDLSLGKIIGLFKSLTTKRYIEGVECNRWQPFYEKLWQRGYYHHIINREKELFGVRQYIINNPLNTSG